MTKEIQEHKGEIVIYQSKEGEPGLQVRLEAETVWLSQRLMAELFQKDSDTVGLHLKNVYAEGELDEKSTTELFSVVQKEGKRMVSRQVKFYNLDAIISVGYRVNSKRGTQFRIWATNVLRDHLVKGYTLNEKRLQENKQRLKELEAAVALVASVKTGKALSTPEASGLLTVITEYTRSWLLLQQYDSGMIQTRELHRNVQFHIDEETTKKAIAQLKKNLMERKEASDLFGRESARGAVKGILASTEQTFDGSELYPSVEEKAANLLYFLIKDHPFVDGNKRIASLLFIWFLEQNNFLSTPEGERKINDNALVALTLLIAESNPKQKEVMIKLIINLIAGN